MHEEDLAFFRKWFLDYVGGFSSPDPLVRENIELKTEHTKRVCKNILLLAKTGKLGEEECQLAETIALFHDLGRFEQFTRYKTFKDSDSENHAVLGVKILKKAGVLSHLSEKEQDLILKAVEYHNLVEIPESAKNSPELLFHSKLVRDADKLDILRLICKDYESGEKSRNPALELYLPDTPECSGPVIEDIMNNKMAKIRDVLNQNDVKLLRLSWVFDINFPETFALLRKHRYLEIIISSLPGTEEVRRVRRHLEDYLEKHNK
ncbi:HD domain-containing protein [Methanosarcina sp. KYL-1]|uniref:HD domain-containing protein n=1 Tax=Methanosarcina sp. KYL-1 TaxID=2602068 RepID=UPI002101489F|nr:HD domain-containing protein [Methanosarcina sp. KYL-1]MCQ1536740.1 HD domain-containing protein [Methanosarcina sp. KYL-1]